MKGLWHTDKKVGQTATLPNGTRVRVAAIRGGRVRLEYVDPAVATSTADDRRHDAPAVADPADANHPVTDRLGKPPRPPDG